ncbi:hypothetical protein [Achromobacter aloeverae]|uniref:Uncharacterized protein n=1 Tax=Achromobacter aloeverae TaxID=1750518 RepID=A0A4Q1HL42_9BURK|nr:hypothetical protein [Achromobacter aloeverae]RXN88025.1 hypothetical protein C7R54_15730 [Achromobacter aloeverae]
MDGDVKKWAISAKTIVSTIASFFVIMSALVAAIGGCVGLYYGLANRVTILEANSQHMGDDVKDIKAMLTQMVMNRVDNRADVQRWAK